MSRITRRRFRALKLWELENRITPATASLSLGTLTINYTATGITAEAVTATNDGTNISLTGNITGSLVNPVGSVSKIVVTDSGLSNNQSLKVLGSAAYSLSGGFSSTDVETIIISKSVNVTGSGTISIIAPKSISISGSAAGLSAVNGDVTLFANQQVTPSSGDFVGIDVSAGTISVSGTGTLSMRGRGGDNSIGMQYGIYVHGGGSVTGGTTNNAALKGTGGASTGSANYGVYVNDALSKITSNGGAVSVTGTGGGSGAASFSLGVQVSNNGVITAGGSGDVQVIGQGGTTVNGDQNYGVTVHSGTAKITSSGGNVSITGTGGGNGASKDNYGVYGFNSGTMSTGGTGNLTLLGTGGGNSTSGNDGAVVAGTATWTAGGSVTVTGIEGPGSSAFGIQVLTSSSITCGAAGTITLISNTMNIGAGTTINAGSNIATLRQRVNGIKIYLGGSDTINSTLGLTDAELDLITAGTLQIGDANAGMILISAAITHNNNLSLTTGADLNSNLTGVTMSVNKSVTVSAVNSISFGNTVSDWAATGTGSIGLTTQKNIVMAADASITTVDGALLSANQQVIPTGGYLAGVDVGGIVEVTGSGALTVLGRGGDSTIGSNWGVWLHGKLSGGKAGAAMSVTGTGGSGASKNSGVVVNKTGGFDIGLVTSSGADVNLTGFGGGSATSSNYGVEFYFGGTVTAGGTGSVNITGTGSSTGAGEHGVSISDSSTNVTSGGGNVKIQGFGGGSGTSNNCFGVNITSGVVVSPGGMGTMQVIGQGGNGTGSNNWGVLVNSSAKITSSGGDVTVTGTGGGTGTGSGGYGVYVNTSSTITTGGTATLSINATGGLGSGGGNSGFIVSAGVISAGGSITITGTGGTASTTNGITVGSSAVISGAGGNVTFIADGIGISSISNVSAGANTVTLRPRTIGLPIDLGTIDTAGKLGLLDAELDMVTCGTLNIGDANSGPINVVGGLTRGVNTNLVITTNSSLVMNANIDWAGGNITLATAGSISQIGGVVTTTGTLLVAAASGQTAVFSTAVNKAGLLVIPVGVICLVSGTFDSSGAVQVDGTLGGLNGSVGTTTVTSTGKIAPGSSPGKITTGNIALNSSSVLAIEINGIGAGAGYDQLAVSGTVNLGGATLSGSLGFAPGVGEVFTIIDNNGSGDAVTGTFNGIVEGGTITLGAYTFKVSYKGGDGNDVTLTVSPPVVTGVTFGDGTNQRSLVKQMVVNFSETVTFTGPVVNAFKLSRSGSSSIPTPTGDVTITTNPVSGSASSVTITFSGSLTEGGSLIDGLYNFTIDASKITGTSGNLDGDNNGSPGGNYSVTGSTVNKYFRYFGDYDGDGNVSQTPDFIEFRNAFGNPSTIFDWDNDGAVDQDDFIKFRNNFGGGP